MKLWISLGAILWTCGFSVTANSASFEVDPFADNDCGDFICDFASALTAASANGQDDTITLASGDYPPGNYNSTENHSLQIIGAGSSDSVIDGAGASPGLVINTSGAAVDAQVEIEIFNLGFQNGLSALSGGGLSVTTNDANLLVQNCEFNFNETTALIAGNGAGGGGLFFFGGDAGSATLLSNRFSNNKADSSVGGGSLAFALSGDVLMQNNAYSDNSALDMTGVNSSIGGGAAAVSVQGELVVDRNRFLNNIALSGGGLVAVVVNGSGTISNNLASNNLADGSFVSSGVASAGGIAAIAPLGSLNVVNNTIVGNRAVEGDGGGLLAVTQIDQASITIANNIIWGNSGSSGGQCVGTCNDLLIQDDVDNNNVGSAIDVFNNDFSDFYADCDPVLGCVPGGSIDPVSNLNLDPLLVNAAADNFELSAASPLIDKGSGSAPGITGLDLIGDFRVQGTAPDMGALESDFTSGGPQPTPSPATENCANNVDDDADTLIDCLDPDCAGAAACRDSTPTPVDERENCGNNIDDDGNGLTDCADSVCTGAVACPADSDDGGSDGDGDGEGEEGGGTNVSANSSCALSMESSAPASALWLFLPLLVALGSRKRRNL